MRVTGRTLALVLVHEDLSGPPPLQLSEASSVQPVGMAFPFSQGLVNFCSLALEQLNIGLCEAQNLCQCLQEDVE